MSIAHYFSSRNRRRKWELFVQEFSPTKVFTILDVGFSDKEYSPVDNYLEKHYPFPQMITAIGVDEPCEFLNRYPKVHVMRYDGKNLPFDDDSFDVCGSNAVIEHVGDRDAQLAFVKEMVRVGKAVYFSTPNRYFPVEPHTRTPLIHYLPKKIFDSFLRATGKSWASGNYMHLLGISDLLELLRRAGIRHYKIVQNRLFGFVLDYVVVIRK
jgi:SAM-dependent methyltransferase